MPSTQADRGSLTADINVTPMIDVLLVLLIMFMFMVPMMQKRIDLTLPDPTPVNGPGEPPIVLEVSAADFRINGTHVPNAELSRALHGIFDGRPTKVLWVKGERTITYQRVIQAMDVARGAGVLVLGVPPKKAEER
jgi:biopolymer transport protein TolR